MNPLYPILSSAMVESVYRVLLQAAPKGVQRIATSTEVEPDFRSSYCVPSGALVLSSETHAFTNVWPWHEA